MPVLIQPSTRLTPLCRGGERHDLPEKTESTARFLAAVLVVLLIIAAGTAIRITFTFVSPAFNAEHPEGQLMSDPALLFYLTRRVVEAGGLPPADFRVDRRVAHPDKTDLPAMFTVGQEFYLALGYRLFGRNLPLHVYCVIAMSLFASLTVFGVFGLTRELTGKWSWAALAAMIYGLTPAAYRTIGFILMREDFSLPLFALHLWLTVRAARVKTRLALLTAALTLTAALATWHAMTFVVTLEAAAVLSWYLGSGRNPFSNAHVWPFPLVLAAGSLLVPVLRAKWFLFSLPMLLMAGLWLLAGIQRRYPLDRRSRPAAVLALCAVSVSLSLALAGDYRHVFDLLWAKLIHLGRLPEDPLSLSFGARLLWQGPFTGGSPDHIARQLGLPGLLLIWAILGAVRNWRRGQGDDRLQPLLAFGALGLVLSFLIQRLVVLTGLLAPVATVWLLSRCRRRRWTWTAAALLVIVQAGLLGSTLLTTVGGTWYQPIESRNLARFLFWAQDNLDGRGAIAADFVNSAAILAHTDHPVILQPKYETRAGRDRIERFFTAFYHGSPADFRALLHSYDCRYLLVDAYLMTILRYQAGLPWQQRPGPGTAAGSFLSTRPERYKTVPGFRLVYTSPQNPPVWRFYALE